MYVRMIVAYALVVFLLGGQGTAAANGYRSGEQPDVFSHENIRIEFGQRIERLLVSGANAVVAGAIDEGIIVVDGSLVIVPGARIGGNIIILGGELKNEAGITFEHAPLIVPPGNMPYTGVVLGCLALLFILSLVAIPYFLWLVLHLMNRFPPVARVKAWLFEIQHRRPSLYIAITLAFSASMLGLFSVLAWQTIFRHATGVFDNAFVWMVRYFASPGLDKTMISITNLGFGFSYGVLVLTTASILAVFRRWIELKGLILCLSGGVVLNEILKHLFERARPEAFHIVAASGFSFPSGHAMISLCFYGMVAFLIVRKRSWHLRIAGSIVTVLLVMAIGVSRIYLGVHYPSDVVAGYASGAMWLGFSISILMWWEKEGVRRQMKETD